MRRDLRVLMVAACPLPWPRGTPIRVHRMAEALAQQGHDVTAVTYPLGDPATVTPYRIVRVAPATLMAPEPGPTIRKLLFLDPLLTREIARLLLRQTFDVVHAHHYEGLIASLIARRTTGSRVPLVYDAHTLLGSELPQYRLALPTRVLALAGGTLDRRLPRRAAHVIAVTERMANWFTVVAGIPAERVSLISNGVEHDHFGGAVTAGESGTGIRAPTPAPPRVVFAGNLAEYQGIRFLLEAFARLRQRRSDAELVFVTGSDLAPLRPEMARLGIEGSVTRLDDNYALLPARLAAADVLVNPRIDCDGLPQKLLNYMAAGRPIVSFAGSAALLRDEQTGLIVPDGDSEAFAAAVVRLLDDPALGQRLGTEARRMVVEAHGWGQVAERVRAVYGLLLPGAG